MKLMTALDASRVELIKREFEHRKNRVGQADFISVMLKHLPVHLYSNRDNAADELFELFKEVDVNGDGTMDWEELTRFMVSKAALLKEKSTALDCIPYHHKTQPDASVPASTVHHRHRDSIDGMCLLPRYRQFACIENHSPVIALYNARNTSLVATMKCKAVPLCVCYIEPLQSLIACCSDSTMARFNVGESHHKVRYQQKSFWSTPDAQMAMCWQPTHNLLYSGSVGGRVHAWDVDTHKQISCFEAHTDIVMDVLNLDCLDSIVSASLDTNIIVVDSYTEQQTARLTGHSKGVNSLCYNSDNRFLISSGFDHDVFVWSPFVSTLLYKLKGHRAALVGCETVEGSPELITADASGLFKLWDLRKFECVQTFTSEHEPGDLDDLTGTLSCFKHMKLPCFDGGGDADDYRVIAASKKLLYFDQERMRANPVSDEGPIRVALFNSQSLTVFTASERTVKIWDAILGSVKHSFKNVTASDISAACLDDRKRKFILGESTGTVSVFNYQNGAVMKEFSPQGSSPVVDLAYSAASKSVLVAYMNGLVRVFDENDIESCKVLRSFDETYSHRGDLYCAVYEQASSVVATGGNLPSDGVRLWDYDSGKCELVLKSGDECEVVALAFLGDYPLVAVCCSDCKIRLFLTHQSADLKGTCVVEWTNELPPGTLITEALDEAVHPMGWGQPGDEDEDSAESRRRERALGSVRHVQARERSSSSMASFEQDTDGSSAEAKHSSPEFTAARKPNKSPVSSVVWDQVGESLFTGSEGGHLRKWGLARTLAFIDAGKLETVEVNGRRRVRCGQRDSSGDREGLSPKRASAAALGRPSSLGEAASLVEFRWGLERAHDADVTVIKLTQEPRALLTASTDKRVLMFSLDGKSLGCLLQTAKYGCQSPQWSLRIDVAQRQAKEARALSAVLNKDEKGGDEGVARREKDEREASHRQHSDGRAKRKGRNAKASRAGKEGGRAGTSQTASEKIHNRVIDVLAKVKTATVRVPTPSGDSGSQTISTQSITLVGDPKLREKNRRLPPHLKANDPIASPPIELTGLGPGFKHQGGKISLPRI